MITRQDRTDALSYRRVRLKHGPVRVFSRGKGVGYRAKCTLCSWTDGSVGHGSYVWHVQERATKHIEEKHDRRKSKGDRRALRAHV